MKESDLFSEKWMIYTSQNWIEDSPLKWKWEPFVFWKSGSIESSTELIQILNVKFSIGNTFAKKTKKKASIARKNLTV